MIRHNFFYKLLALAIATFLWVYVNAERNPQSSKVVSVPIEVRNLSKGYTAELSTSEVSVTIAGPKLAVDAVRTGDIRAWIDLARLQPARGVVESRARVLVRLAGNNEDRLVVTTKPSAVRVRVEAILSKRLPVEPELTIAPPPGYSFREPLVRPAMVRIYGKASNVARVRRVIVPVSDSFSGRAIDGYFEIVPVDASGNRVSGIVMDIDKVHLKMDVVEVPATKTVVVSENIVGRPKYPARITRVSIVPPSVTIEAKPRILLGISTIETEEVSVEGATSSLTKHVALRVPPGVRVLGPSRVQVSVIIEQGE